VAKILFLAHRVPFPPNKGDKIRAFHELEHLARHHDIWLGASADDPADLEHLAQAKRLFQDAYFGRPGPVRTVFNLTRAALNGTPLSVARFYHPGLMGWCARILQNIRPDIVFVFSSAAAQFVLRRLPHGTKLIADFVDADAEKWRAYAQTSMVPQRWLYRTEFRRLVRYEAKVAAAAAANVFVSQTERDLFAGFVPEATPRLSVVPNGVDTEFFSPAPAFGAALAGSIVFSGTMDYKPNIDAVSWFARDILPLVRRSVPGAHLRIVGAKPSAGVLALAKLEGVEVTGSVPDMRPYLQQAGVIVAPLRIARGIQNKVLEGMAMARPVVTTPEALDGIAARPDTDLLVAGNAAEFAEKVTAILQGRAPPALGANARATVVEHYSWVHHLNGLDQLIARALHNGSSQAAADKR
jgi:sugar transferase (PEP-CTERM/EpsH1 system associated)